MTDPVFLVAWVNLALTVHFTRVCLVNMRAVE